MKSKLVVLIVEDERIISMMMGLMVEKLGHRVCAKVPSVDAALELLDTVHPDLAFLDIHLEGDSDGIYLGRILGSQFGIPFAFATAYADPDTYRRAMDTVPVDFLQKPLAIEAIKRVCDTVLSA
jgi:DNA-binding NtrC family response regulator